MSKLAQIRKALQENSNITIVRVNEVNNLPDCHGFWAQTVDFYVAPKTDLHKVSDLQNCLTALIPNLKPTEVDDFMEFPDHLNFGVLYYDEVIGAEITHRDLIILDEDLPLPSRFEGGLASLNETRNISRRTWVRLYPNEEIARRAHNGVNQYSIKIREYQ